MALKTFSVKEVAEKLGTNQETVRRWIRDKQLDASQLSRKEGNVVSEAALEAFVKSKPKYASRLGAGLGMAGSLAPVIGLGVTVGGMLATALLLYYKDRKKPVSRDIPPDFENYVSDRLQKVNDDINTKRELIAKTEEEIRALQNKADQYAYLLEHKDELPEILREQEEQ